ncbi:hypothetical protein J2W42_003300 [Rhizobium tibeticum]|nr:hypothetical protein [Rhizobium tibeticum]
MPNKASPSLTHPASVPKPHSLELALGPCYRMSGNLGAEEAVPIVAHIADGGSGIVDHALS